MIHLWLVAKVFCSGFKILLRLDFRLATSTGGSANFVVIPIRMLLVHIHNLPLPLIRHVDGIGHSIYINNEYHVSDIYSTDKESRGRFSISETCLENEIPTWANEFDDVNLFAKQIEQLENFPFKKSYTFAVASSFLLRSTSHKGYRTVCWTHPREFLMIGWGNGNRYRIKIRHDDHVYDFACDRKTIKLVAGRDDDSRPVDPIRDLLDWQFHQATAYELNYQDIEELSSTPNLVDTRWQLVAG